MKNARYTVLTILNSLSKKRITLDASIEKYLREDGNLSKIDKSFVTAIVFGVLRWQRRLDWIISHFSNIKLKKIDPNVLNILRIGLFQIIYLDKVPVSAAVNTSVDLCKSPVWISKYINAVLRKASENYQDTPFPPKDKDYVLYLAVQKSFPEWLIKRWLEKFGFDEINLICDALNNIPPISIRANSLKISRDALFLSLKNKTKDIFLTEYAPYGISFFSPNQPIFELDEYKNGFFQVQDEASQIVTMVLDPKPYETVLDTCAGLGGKTGHIAQLMENKGRILAIDNDKRKLDELEFQMKRLGINIVETRVHDMMKPLNPDFFQKFDKVLVDAPCSASGVLRRNPDIKWSLSEIDLCRSRDIQNIVIKNASKTVKNTGKLVYSVCSTEVEENEEVITYFLDNNKNFKIDVPFNVSHKIDTLINEKGFIKTFPHKNNMDGFYIVRLEN
ncbi:MAG: 16S rRNA (cytosine(967)-C(5))-methyltransferase RsmB [Desulfobacterales bacterium]|nr:16S rRNA (cytosine(967)-C(5))-methyltransferase RsmB [Desulfobacterales bacterium]